MEIVVRPLVFTILLCSRFHFYAQIFPRYDQQLVTNKFIFQDDVLGALKMKNWLTKEINLGK